MPPREPRSLQASAHVLLLKGLSLLAVGGLAFLLAWRCGLLARVWHADPTGIAVAITLVLLAAGAHGSIALLRLWCALRHLARVQRQVAAGAVSLALPEGCVRRYVRDLHAKASLSGARTVDRALLLETFEAELRQDRLFGGFVADLLLSLGLLGTVIGLVVMLGPIGGRAAGGPRAEGVLAALSGGLAVVLYTTLAGLLGGALLKLQGVLLDRAVDELVRRTAGLTETLLPTIQRLRRDAAAV